MNARSFLLGVLFAAFANLCAFGAIAIEGEMNAIETVDPAALRDEAIASITRWRLDPVAFVRECLRVEEIDPWQLKFLENYRRALHDPTAKKRIGAKACKGPGKTAGLAWIGWHFTACFPNSKVICTSVSGSNLKDGLWTEFAKWQANSPLLKSAYSWRAERIVSNDLPETWFISARQWSHSANSEQQANTLAGIHGDHVLILIDEGGDIPPAVVAAAEGALANAGAEGRIAVMAMMGNPTGTTGSLYRACTRERGLWEMMSITADPNDPDRASRVSITWAREQIEKYGVDNAWVLVNVFGEFPPGQSNALLSLEDVEKASRRTLADRSWRDAAKVLGIDVARFGDDTTEFAPRQGRMCFPIKTFRNLDTMDVADQAALAIQKWKPDAVFIDITGLGAGVYDRLIQLGYQVQGVDFGGRPIRGEPKLADRRSDMWWSMADWVKSGGCIPEDAELIRDLVGPTYGFNARGALKLESKEQMKSRGISSPNKGDALALTFAAPVMVASGIRQAGTRGKAIIDHDPLGGS